jgi:hypothetical protein
MQPWQERVVQEQRELQAKLDALDAFLSAPFFGEKIHPDEQKRLVAQSGVMAEYNNILRARINAFNDPVE